VPGQNGTAAPTSTEVLDVIFTNGNLQQFDMTGVKTLGKIFWFSAKVAD